MEKPKEVFSSLVKKASLLDAWRLIQKKRSAGGIDRVSVEFYEKDFNNNIDKLQQSLQSGRYVPEPYQRILIQKEHKPGEFRPLSLPTINDKIVQQALKNILEPIVNPHFLDINYAYRAGKGSTKALLRISHIIQTQKISWVSCADIDSFFDNMNHETLMTELHKYVAEPEISKLIQMWLKIGVVSPGGEYEDSLFGIAQGSVISPLLSNIFLHPLDVYLTQKGCHYLRYADNFILLSQSREQIQRDFDSASYFLKNVLKLSLNRQKSYFFELKAGFVFMGIFFRGTSRLIDHSRIQRMENRLRYLVRSRLFSGTNFLFKKLDEIITGFDHYYGKLTKTDAICNRFNLFLQHTIIDTLLYHFTKQNEAPHKTQIKAMLSGIPLFGMVDTSVKDKWIIDIADECVAQYDRHLASRLADTRQQTPSHPNPSADLRIENVISEEPVQPVQAVDGTSKETGSNDTVAPAADTAATNAAKTADRAVRKQKAKYKKLESVSREVVIESQGVFVGLTHKNLVVKKKGVKILAVPLERVETINITSKGISLSSDIIRYCSSKRIPLYFSDGDGLPACVLQNPLSGDADLGLLQLQCIQDGHLALELAKEFIEGKIRNQLNLLKYYARHRNDASLYGSALKDEIPSFHQAIQQIAAMSLNGNGLSESRNVLMGHEANAARRYWKMVKILLGDDVPDFPGREGQGARDLVNSLLNYGYGFLYRQVWREVILSGLNPKISFLHSPQGEKPVLIYDLVEEFRPQAVDRTVFSMLTKNERLSIDKASGMLDKQTRKKLIEALLERQGTAVAYLGEKVLLKNVIRHQIRRLCNHLKGEDTYRHFTGYY